MVDQKIDTCLCNSSGVKHKKNHIKSQLSVHPFNHAYFERPENYLWYTSWKCGLLKQIVNIWFIVFDVIPSNEGIFVILSGGEIIYIRTFLYEALPTKCTLVSDFTLQ